MPISKKSNPKGIWSSLGSALLIELALVGVAVGWVIMHPHEEIAQVMPLVMSMLDAPKEVQPPPPKPTKVPEIQPKVKAVVPVSPAVPEVRPPEEPAPPVVAKPTAFSAPAPLLQPPAAAPVMPPPAPVVDPTLAYNVKLAAAVQAAFVLPGPAAALGFKGRARVEFHLRDGVVSNAKIIQASGLGAVDRAALKAVEVASFPVPPPTLVGKEGVYQIWVACY
jgi:protein TonB